MASALLLASTNKKVNHADEHSVFVCPAATWGVCDIEKAGAALSSSVQAFLPLIAARRALDFVLGLKGSGNDDD